MRALGSFWRLALAALVTGVLLVMFMNAITNPVTAAQRTYTAEFVDVSGLHRGGDVRIRGVRVGKVVDIRLTHHDGRSTALVDLTMDRAYGVVAETKLAVKFQALTGLRYIDVTGYSEGPGAQNTMTNISTSMTRSSFDVTALFNGLQPVLATLTPEQINIFADNAVSYLSGDGEGLRPLLDSIHKLAAFSSDRQAVVAKVMENLSNVADHMGGEAPKLAVLINMLQRPLDSVLMVIDEFRKTQMYGASFGLAVDKMLENAGLTHDGDYEAAMDRALTNLSDGLEAFKRLPVIWQNIPEPSGDSPSTSDCSKGPAALPRSVDVLLNGQRVVLCRK
ncbi:MlaD family protein [Mycobacterium syngnathidarum]